MIVACININQGLLETLNQSASKAGLARSLLAHRLFRKVMKEKRLLKPKLFARVRYQAVDPEKKWEKVKISLQGDMFEICHDMRKILKVSVSALLAYAIRIYLDDIINEIISNSAISRKKMDNYSSTYSVSCVFQDEMDGFEVQWLKKPKIN